MTAPAERVSTSNGVPARRSRFRLLKVMLVVVLVLLLAVFLGGSWYFSGQVGDGITVKPLNRVDNVRIVAATPTTLTLEPTGRGGGTSALDESWVYGVDWGEGSGQVSAVVEEEGDRVTRTLRILGGDPPTADDTARFSRSAFPDDAERALDVPVREVTVASESGDLVAWYAPGRGSTWAVLTHGRGEIRSELFRLMRVTTSLEIPTLAVSYRRDPENGGGVARFGQDEWRDLEAAVRQAVDQGARSVVLVGCSMGGAISASFLENSALADRVEAVVFDAPMLDFRTTVEHGADQRSVPGLGVPIPAPIVWGAEQLSALRYDLDLDAVDYLDDTDWLTVPALVFHGGDDGTVPDVVTRRLEKQAPDLVSAVYVPDADHVESWNLDPPGYEAEVVGFLTPFAP